MFYDLDAADIIISVYMKSCGAQLVILQAVLEVNAFYYKSMILYLWLLVIVNPLACCFTGGIGCKCSLLQKDDYVSMVVSTAGEFVGESR